MDTSKLILMMIIGCIVFMAAVVFNKQIKKIVVFLLQASLGALGIMGVNSILGLIGITTGIGINFLSMFMVGVLGIPGFVLIYCIGFLI